MTADLACGRALAESIAQGASGHVVYLLSAAEGDVIYIGRSGDLPARLRGHSGASDWWPHVASGWWYPCDDIVTARLLERESIARYRPRYNVNDTVEVRPARVSLPSESAEVVASLYREAAGTPRLSTENQRLNGYIWLLRQAGWSLAAIGCPLGFTREAIRRRELDAVPIAGLPSAPRLPVRIAPERPVRKQLRVRTEIADYLRGLHSSAREVNGGTPADDPRRVASVDLTEALAMLLAQGVTIAEMARALDVHHNAVRARLGRHGYIKRSPSVSGLIYRGEPTHQGPQEQCGRGHLMAGVNLRLVNGDESRRVCRACERMHQAAYRARQAERTALPA